jgi:hypothetical protein
MQSVTEDRIGSHSTQLKRAVQMYLSGMSAKAAADAAHFPRSTLYKHLRFANQLRVGPSRYQSRLPLDPTEETIWSEAKKIRDSWTGEERAKRYVGGGSAAKLDQFCEVLRRRYQGAA